MPTQPSSVASLEVEIKRLKEIKTTIEAQQEKQALETQLEPILHPYFSMTKRIGQAVAKQLAVAVNNIDKMDRQQHAPSASPSFAVYKCRLLTCKRIFETKWEAEAHMALDHGFVEKCGYLDCDKYFENKAKLYEHLATVHMEPQQELQQNRVF